jgi:hypothetical protein
MEKAIRPTGGRKPMSASDISSAIVDFYRGEFPENISGIMIRIDFKSSAQVKALLDGLTGIAEGRHKASELSTLLDVVYRSPVQSFRVRLAFRQTRGHRIRVEENGSVLIEWTATKEALEDSAFLLEGLAEHSGGHQHLTDGRDGAEIIAAFYK